MLLRILAVLLAPIPALAAEIHVAAAASLSDVLRELGAMHERTSRDRLVFNFAASNILARQIQQGAPADLFISADESRMNQVAILRETRRELLSNALVIVAPRNSAIRTPRDLVRAKRIALANPDSVPAGIYAKQYLTSIGLWTQLAPKVIPTENVRGALAAADGGNVDAAIVYRTDARIAKHVRVVFEIANGPKIVYPAAVLRDAKQPLAARRFLQFLTSNEAAAIFRKHGFIVR
jgi:molybdate transport system substrate-binding protein